VVDWGGRGPLSRPNRPLLERRRLEASVRIRRISPARKYKAKHPAVVRGAASKPACGRGRDTRLDEKLYREYMQFFEKAERERRRNVFDDIPWDRVNKSASEELALCAETFCSVEMYLPDYVAGERQTEEETIYVHDPDGNNVQLVAFGRLQPAARP